MSKVNLVPPLSVCGRFIKKFCGIFVICGQNFIQEFLLTDTDFKSTFKSLPMLDVLRLRSLVGR